MNSYIHERQSIPIPMNNINSFENNKLSLNHTLIDPFKMSPPNSFMEKLMKRMDNYYSPTKRENKKNNFSLSQ
jgi:hypothetical protein